MKFEFIRAEKAHFPISKLCRSLRVSRSGYYAWFDRPPSARADEDLRIAQHVEELHTASRGFYGSPRIHRDLLERGVRVSRKRVIRIMRGKKLVGRVRRRYRATTMSEHDQPVAPNVLDRDFEAARPNERWVADTTELRVGSSGGRLFLAAILDLYSRFVVGWAVSAVNDRHLVIKALEKALQRRQPARGLLHHSDQGCTYASEDYRKLLEAHGAVASMSRRGNCHDNAVAESWFATLKAELGEQFESYGTAKAELFDYIEVFYNQRRRHSAVGSISPAEFERRNRNQQAA